MKTRNMSNFLVWTYLSNFLVWVFREESVYGVMERAWTLDTDGHGFKSWLTLIKLQNHSYSVLVFSAVKSECYYLPCSVVWGLEIFQENVNKCLALLRNSTNVYWADVRTPPCLQIAAVGTTTSVRFKDILFFSSCIQRVVHSKNLCYKIECSDCH